MFCAGALDHLLVGCCVFGSEICRSVKKKKKVSCHLACLVSDLDHGLGEFLLVASTNVPDHLLIGHHVFGFVIGGSAVCPEKVISCRLIHHV